MVIVVGSLNMDLVIKAPKIPRPGETVLGYDFKQVPGGKGGNQAAACAKLNMKTRMFGAIGKDSMGNFLKESLANDGVDIDNVVEKDNFATGIAAIVVDDGGNNAITVSPGANSAFRSYDLEDMEDGFKGGKALLVQLETPIDTVRKALEIANKYNMVKILNPAPALLLEDDIYSLVDILTPNESELELLTGLPTSSIDEVKIAGESLIKKGVKNLIVTLGKKGSLHLTRDYYKYYEAYKVKAIDTTGAGDSFNAGLAVSLSRGNPIEEAITFATKVGAITVTRPGAQTSLPLLSEVEAFEKWYKINRLEGWIWKRQDF